MRIFKLSIKLREYCLYIIQIILDILRIYYCIQFILGILLNNTFHNYAKVEVTYIFILAIIISIMETFYKVLDLS